MTTAPPSFLLHDQEGWPRPTREPAVALSQLRSFAPCKGTPLSFPIVSLLPPAPSCSSASSHLTNLFLPTIFYSLRPLTPGPVYARLVCIARSPSPPLPSSAPRPGPACLSRPSISSRFPLSICMASMVHRSSAGSSSPALRTITSSSPRTPLHTSARSPLPPDRRCLWHHHLFQRAFSLQLLSSA